MKNLLIIAIVLFTISCKKDNTDDNGTAGHFLLKLTTSLKSGMAGSNANSTDFNLDTLKSSRSFYFLLSNTGQNDITEITITSDNAAFTPVPSKVKVLAGSKNNSASGFSQLISLDIEHGLRINGIGYANLLKQGNNVCRLTIKGFTSNGTSVVTVSLETNIKIFAKVMDIELWAGNSKYDLFKPSYQALVLGPPFNNTLMNAYKYDGLKPIIIKNIGNTKIDVTSYENGTVNTVIESFTIYPNGSKELIMPNDQNKSKQAFIQLDAMGTVVDRNKISQGASGCAYFSMVYSNEPVVIPIDSTKIK